MKNNSITRYIIFTLIGFVIFGTGAILGKLNLDIQIMQTLPYILIGIGAGIFGQNLGTAFSIYTMRKCPQFAKQKEIEERDERNITIRNKAKGKAYDLMLMVFGALMVAFALMKVDMTVVLAMVIAYLFVVFSNIYYIGVYQKEM